MKIDILTLFPETVDHFLSESIIGRARKAGCLEINTHNFRDYAENKHNRVDDTPYGGGKGMLLAAPPIIRCYEHITKDTDLSRTRTIYLSPQGKVLTQKKAEELARCDRLILLCGHYEGIDERVIDEIIDEEISIGDYVLTGGELAACVLADCVGRLAEGVLADESCHEIESISCGMLEYPQYTKPVEFHGRKVPEVLLGGNHADIDRWRYEQALLRTRKKRPDLL